MGIEEQKEEREVLESIFADEITGKRIVTQANANHLPSMC